MMQSMTYRKIQHMADRAAAGCAVALGVSIPISTALDSILVVLLLFFWLIGDVPGKLKLIRHGPIALASLAFYLLLILGCFYGDAVLGQKLTFLSKYKALLCFPLLVPLFANARIRRAGFIGFTLAIVLTLALSAIIKTGWVPALNHRFPFNPVVGAIVFRGHIAQSYMLSVAAFIYGIYAQQASGRQRLLFGLLALSCIGNVLFMIYSRTGYVVLAVLLIYFFATLYPKSLRGVVIGAVVLGLAAAITVGVSHKFDHRIEAAVHEAEQWNPKQASHTSNGMRLEFYRNTFLLIKKHPLLGSGTGGFADSYRQQVAGKGMVDTQNPHNEMLLITAQLGALGLAALWFFYIQYWKQAGTIPDRSMRRISRAVLLSLIIGGLMNSLLINHAEALFFAWWSAWAFGTCGGGKKALEL